MNKTLYLMQGIPGSGKSTVAKTLGGVILSTDDFWWSRGSYEIYDYDPSRITEAHLWNQRRVAACMQIDNPPINTIIVDNTNIKQEHIVPYLALAKMFEYEPTIIRVQCDLATALARNLKRSADRRIPSSVIHTMYNEMENLYV